MSDKPRHSKRYGLSKLDPQWREKIFASLHSQRLKLAVAVLSCSGCRPAELERGVIVRFHNNQLQLGIYGSKVDAQTGRGQPVRLLVVDQSRTWAQFLISELCRHESRHMTIKYDAGGYPRGSGKSPGNLATPENVDQRLYVQAFYGQVHERIG